MVTSVDDIFEKFGGPSQLGEAIGVSRTHAGTMKARKSIPPEYWQRLVAAATERGIEGVTLEALAAIAARKATSEAPPTIEAAE
jgi:hypothetical protein